VGDERISARLTPVGVRLYREAFIDLVVDAVSRFP
jgi:hypothetical protein